jgi:hypothetical protein
VRGGFVLKAWLRHLFPCACLWLSATPILAHIPSDTAYYSTAERLQSAYESIRRDYPRDHIQVELNPQPNTSRVSHCSVFLQNFAQEMKSLARFLTFAFRKPEDSNPQPRNITYRGLDYPHLKALEWEGYSVTRSFRYLPRALSESAEIDLLMWHGFGAKGSHAQGFFQPIRTLTDERDRTQKSVRKMLAERGRPFISVAPEALDLPESGNGPTVLTEQDVPEHILSELSLPYRTLDSTMDRLGRYVEQRKHPFRKTVGLGKSASVGLMAELNYRRPELFDALVFIGPLHPAEEIGFRYSVDAYFESVGKKLFEPNLRAFHWVNRMYEKMRWHHETPPFKGKPTLILIGESDVEVSPQARQWFKALSAQYPNVTVVEIPGAPHDPLMPNGRLKYNPDHAHFVLQSFFLKVRDPQ